MLTVYKASAGSGKTFRLVIEYLKLLMADGNNYRHILAVTFTNKATAEMKERVVEQLSHLANGRDTAYRQILLQETGLSGEELNAKSGIVLEAILFDYNRFSVSTIDKFTQRVIKAFNREVGITPNFQIELDSDLIINEAVDRLISAIGTNKALRKWLEDFIDEKIRNNKNFGIEKDLKSLGKELFKERLQENLQALQTFFNNPESIKNYLDMLNRNIHGFESSVIKQAKEIVEKYTASGYTSDDFSGKTRGIGSFLEKISRGTIPAEISKTAMAAAESEDKWVAKAHPGRSSLITLVTSHLIPMLNALISFFNDHTSSYTTAMAIKNEWYTMAVLLDLNNQITLLNREKSILPLANSNILLKSIIDGNDTPFIYEKTGNTYHHFMLDEFQDTSAMQWGNFRPLISNALGLGASNLAVGDVKQSIYRWRNSNWNILATKVFDDFPGFDIAAITLDSNFRSDERVVSFNNSFFKLFVKQMTSNDNLAPVIDFYNPVIDSIYADVEQKPAKDNKGEGYVRIEFLGDGDNGFRENTLRQLEAQIKLLQDNGFPASDIAILVRTNFQGEEVVKYFLGIAQLPENLKYNLKVLSNESLFLRSSPAVNFTINIIRHLNNKEDRLIMATLLQLYDHLFSGATPSSHADPGLFAQPEDAWYMNENFGSAFEETIAPKIRKIETQILTSSTDEIIIKICAEFGLFERIPAIPFLQALIDKAAEIRKNMTNDLSNFLLWWEEKGQSESVHVNDEVDAVRLLTIHKSKGLEFRAVLVPFFDWKLTDRSNIIWCIPGEAPFSDAPLVPVAFGPALSKTIFAGDYYHELFNVLVDNINLAYVAFTRARSVLMINTPQKCSNNTIGYYFDQTIKEMAASSLIDTSSSSGDQLYETGTLPELIPDAVPGLLQKNIKWHFTPFDSRLRLRTDSDDFVQVLEEGMTRKNLGKVIHAILSDIKVVADMEQALKKAERSGIIQPAEVELIRKKTREMVNHPGASAWFDGSHAVLNEKLLLTPGHLYRPDRIMIRGGEAVIVDFKSGALKKASHCEQVGRYCHALKESGIAVVNGYLWYLHTNEIEPVVLK